MKAKLMKAVALASLGAFLTVGIGANVAQAKDYHFKIGENHRMVKNDDGTVDSSAHPWYKVNDKKKKQFNIFGGIFKGNKQKEQRKVQK